MNLIEELNKNIVSVGARVGLDLDPLSIRLEYPENPEHGDYSTNVALIYAKQVGSNPKALAEKIVEEFKKDLPQFIESVSVAGPGFINFKIKNSIFVKKIMEVASGDGEYGWSDEDKGKQVMVEYTDPNPFKVFHIGHLMANTVGESISRLVQSGGADVIRACYQGDVGLHVAKTIWAITQDQGSKIKDPKFNTTKEGVNYLGKMYVVGSNAYEENPEAQKEINVINKKVFEKSDPEINLIYEEGRKWSLEYFDEIYKLLGTKFNNFFFESEVADVGVKIVKEFLPKGVFQESEGAVIFKGDDHGVHTRVFITSNGLPTYETKELGLNTEKFKLYPKLDRSIIVTANEQSDYFKVLLKVFSLINPLVGDKTKHMSHGILRRTDGKMSSRKGNIVSAESLIAEIKNLVKEKIATRDFTPEEVEEISDTIAIGAIKYTILRQSIGSDVIFDSAKSISFEGDSGPYLQYAVVRAKAVLEKAKVEGLIVDASILNSHFEDQSSISQLEKLISRFPDMVTRSRREFAPQHLASYLIALAGAFNSFYASQVIVDKNDSLSLYRVAVTKSFVTVMNNGLWVLGIKIPHKM